MKFESYHLYGKFLREFNIIGLKIIVILSIWIQLLFCFDKKIKAHNILTLLYSFYTLLYTLNFLENVLNLNV